MTRDIDSIVTDDRQLSHKAWRVETLTRLVLASKDEDRAERLGNLALAAEALAAYARARASLTESA